jgi:hypothetical protein
MEINSNFGQKMVHLKNNDLTMLSMTGTKAIITSEPQNAAKSENVKCAKPIKMPKNVSDAENNLRNDHEKLTKLATTEKALNGLTYAEATKIIHEYANLVKICPNGNDIKTDEQRKDYDYTMGILKEKAVEFKNASDAKTELLGKYPELIGWKTPELQPGKTTTIPNINYKEKTVNGNIKIEQKEDGTEVSTKTDKDNNVISISTKYQGGGSVTEYYSNGKLNGKVIVNGGVTAYYDNAGKLVATLTFSTDKPILTDGNGNKISPKTSAAKQLAMKIANIIGSSEMIEQINNSEL